MSQRCALNETMSKRALSLDSLHILAACVRHGSFSKAAAEFHITPAAVSQRVRELEAKLGVSLFRRHGPRLTATVYALALGQRLEHAFALVQAAVDECRTERFPLRVTCAPSFAARWLIPRLMAYQSLPEANAIALDCSQSVLPGGSFDVAVRNGVGPWPVHGAARLMQIRRTPMLSPTLWPSGSRLTAQSFAKLPLIPDRGWSEWLALAGLGKMQPKFVTTRLPNHELEAQAAVNGVGVALLSPELFKGLIEEGLLIAPFSQSIAGAESYWLLWTKEAAESHFVRWMKAQFSE